MRTERSFLIRYPLPCISNAGVLLISNSRLDLQIVLLMPMPRRIRNEQNYKISYFEMSFPCTVVCFFFKYMVGMPRIACLFRGAEPMYKYAYVAYYYA